MFSFLWMIFTTIKRPIVITIENAKNLHGDRVNIHISSEKNLHINAEGLLAFPGLIDPHVHFRTPGLEYKENWSTAAIAAISGGYTTVFDMPNTIPPTVSAELLQEKKFIIQSQLQAVNIPLRYHLFFGADKAHFSEIYKVREEVIGIKVFMGCSTGNLVIDDDESLHAVFAIAASQNLIVAVHAEDEKRLDVRKKQYNPKNYADHSFIRDEETARLAVLKAIHLAKIYRVKLYILHVSTHAEIELISKAKADGLAVYAETTPHHLFLNEAAYPLLLGKAVVNPPLRKIVEQSHLFQAIADGVIDTIGSDHAPHTIAEKEKPYPSCPSGMPGIETTLPLLLTAYHQEKISLEKIHSLTVTRAEEIFGLTRNEDIILIDLHKKATVTSKALKTKCAWSSFENWELQGWPVYTIIQGQCFNLSEL